MLLFWLLKKLQNKKIRVLIILLLSVLITFAVMRDSKAVAETYIINLEANPSILQRNQQVTLRARVTDEFSIPRINVPVDFYDERTSTFLGSDTTDNVGWAELVYTIPADDPLGAHIIRAEKSGEPAYYDTTTVQVIGTMSLTLEITPDTQLKGSDVDLTATVVLANTSTPIPDVEVTFYDETENIVIGNGITNSEGMATYIWHLQTFYSSGLHQVKAFANTTDYGEGIDYATVEIFDPLKIELEMSHTEIDRGQTLTLNVTIKDPITSTPEVSVTVNFYDNDVLIGNAITDDQGFATYDYMVPLGASYGTHIIKTTVYEGDARFSKDTETLTVYMNITVNATLSSSTVTRENSITVSVTVTDELGNRLPGYTVELYDTTIDQVIANNVTDDNGQANLTYGIPIDSPTGQHTLVIRLVNVSQYIKHNEVEKTLEVYANTDLHVELLVTEAEQGDTIEITASLTDNLRNDLEGYTIFFYAGDTLLGSAITNANGIAVFIWLVDNSVLGQQQVRAEFIASGYYYSSVSNAETIDIHSNSITILSDLTVERGESHTVKARIMKDGKPQTNVTVKLYAEIDGNWQLMDERKTDDNGEVELSMTVQDELGSQRIKIVTDSTTKTATLKVKYKPDMDIDIDTGIELGNTLNIKVTLKDYNGEPIRVKISIYFNSELLISGTTDEEGSIETTVTPSVVGEYEVKITFESIPNAIVETIKKTVRVGERLDIEYEENPVLNGENTSIKVTFRFANGTAMANTSIDVHIDGYGENSDVTSYSALLQAYSQDDYYATIQTDDDGVATFSMKDFDDGVYLVRLIFYRNDIRESVEIEIQATVQQQGVVNFPLIANIANVSLISVVSVLGICIAIGALMYVFFIRTSLQPFDPLPLQSEAILLEPQEVNTTFGCEKQKMDNDNSVYELPSFSSDMVDPAQHGVKAIFLIAFDLIIGPTVKECRLFDPNTDFSEVIMDPAKLTSFYTMCVTREQLKLEESNEYVFVKTVTSSIINDTTISIQGDTIAQNLLVIVTRKQFDEEFVLHLSKILLVEWPDRQGYLAHQMDQFIPKNMVEMNLPALL